MGKPYAAADRERALALYVTEGPTKASKSTKIPKGTITKWAKAAGLETVSTEKTRAATEAAQAKWAAQRQDLRQRLLDKAEDVLKRMDAEHEELKVVSDGSQAGSHVERVVRSLPTAGDVKDYAMAAGILIDKMRLELGETTGRERHDVNFAGLSDEELDAELTRFASAWLTD